MIAGMAEPSANPVDAVRRSLRTPKPVPVAVAAALAALVPLQARYADLEREELAVIDAVLAAGGNWSQIAEVLGLGSRQAARQHGQRLRQRVDQRRTTQTPLPADPTPDPDTPAPAARPERHQPRRTSRRQRRR